MAVVSAGRYGESMSDKRRRWIATGRCRGSGGPLEPGEKRCKRCRSKRGRGEDRKAKRDLVAIEVRMPSDLYRAILADATERGESVETWIVAEARAALDESHHAAGEEAGGRAAPDAGVRDAGGVKPGGRG